MPRKPGVYYDVPNGEYHKGLIEVADVNGVKVKPLSSTGAKVLVKESPADYLWSLQNRVEKKAFDLGSAAHELILEGGLKTVEVFQFDSWRTKEARAARDECYAAGGVPMLEHELDAAYKMADAVKRHQRASALLTEGRPEVSALVWDEEYQIHFQVRFDWLRNDGLIVDLKTAREANPREFNRDMAKFSYHLQASLYLRAAEILGLGGQRFTWVIVQNADPYHVSVVEYSELDRLIGDRIMHTALTKYAEGIHTGHWPAYDGIYTSELPAWAEYEADEITGDRQDLEGIVI